MSYVVEVFADCPDESIKKEALGKQHPLHSLSLSTNTRWHTTVQLVVTDSYCFE